MTGMWLAAQLEAEAPPRECDCDTVFQIGFLDDADYSERIERCVHIDGSRIILIKCTSSDGTSWFVMDDTLRTGYWHQKNLALDFFDRLERELLGVSE